MHINNSRILIRFDDFCQGMNWDNWNRVKKIIDFYEIKCLIGVVPDNMDEKLIIENARYDFWDYIKQLQQEGHTIAMHGYRHLYDSYHKGIVTYRKKSEFAGLPFDIQFERIKAGKQIMEKQGVSTTIFFAPGHSYDLKTLKALRKNGFYYMSDGKHERIIERKGVVCIPCKYSVAPSYDVEGLHTMVIHINNWDSQDYYEEFEHFCAEMCQSIISFEDIANIRQGVRGIEVIKEWLFVRYEHYLHNVLRSIYYRLVKDMII